MYYKNVHLYFCSIPFIIKHYTIHWKVFPKISHPSLNNSKGVTLKTQTKIQLNPVTFESYVNYISLDDIFVPIKSIWMGKIDSSTEKISEITDIWLSRLRFHEVS